jgi:hypothetical protein
VTEPSATRLAGGLDERLELSSLDVLEDLALPRRLGEVAKAKEPRDLALFADVGRPEGKRDARVRDAQIGGGHRDELRPAALAERHRVQ